MTARWPWHPCPRSGEALSSWLGRIAEDYAMPLEDLVGHGLGAASLPLRDPSILDIDPPAGVLAAVCERTGLPYEHLRYTTAAGWVPWLADTLEASDPAAFDTYVRQDSVLFGPQQRRRGQMPPPQDGPQWRAWLPAMPRRRGCPACWIAGDRWFPVLSPLPLMTSCPEHGCRLIDNLSVFWIERGEQRPEPVSDQVVAMDRLTWEGLTTGMVTLPMRAVHVAIWFRLLRVLLDEVNTLTSRLRPAAQKTMWCIWDALGRRSRDGQMIWRPYEDLGWARQQIMLEAAATALHLIVTGDISAGGSLAGALRVRPSPSVHDGDLPNPMNYWGLTIDNLEAAFDAACHDRQAAIKLLRFMTRSCRSQSGFDRRRQDLIWCRVPAEFLPRNPMELMLA